MRQIAVYGGAFDPPHIGHLKLIHSLSSLPGLDEIWLLPCGDRNDKKLLLCKDTRFKLMKMLFNEQKKVKISDEEIEMSKALGAPVQTYDLLNKMKAKYLQTKFHFVIGSDVLDTIHLWGQAKQLQQQNSFIVFHRKGHPLNQDKLPLQNRVIDVDLPEISSSYLKKVIGTHDMKTEEKRAALNPWLTEQVLNFMIAQKVI